MIPSMKRQIVKKCLYPECDRFTDERMFYPPYRLCSLHHEYIKVCEIWFEVYNNNKLSNIWYKKQLILGCVRGRNIYILYINEKCIIEYGLLGTVIMTRIFMSDVHHEWYVCAKRIDNSMDDFDSIIYPYTYKGRLYEMRLSESYFGLIPRDILDEVIKYL